MTRLMAVMLVLTAAISSSVALIPEVMAVSIFFLNALSGSSQMQLILGTIIAQAAALAVQAGIVPSPQALASGAIDMNQGSAIIDLLTTKTRRSADRNSEPQGEPGPPSDISNENFNDALFNERVEKFKQIAKKIAEQVSDNIGLNRTTLSDILKEGPNSPCVRAALEIILNFLHKPADNFLSQYAIAVIQEVTDFSHRHEGGVTDLELAAYKKYLKR